jgi:hypothetical protein
MTPAYSDTQVVEESQFDWSQVPGRWRTGEDIFEYFKRERDLWEESGICPNPRAYEIFSSAWLTQTGLSRDSGKAWKHYPKSLEQLVKYRRGRFYPDGDA